MTKSQFVIFEANVAHFLKSNVVKSSRHGPLKPDSEPFFSGRQCECCKSTLGGNRETYSFAVEKGETFEGDICSDCIYYLAYGTLDDLTMMEMEK